MSRRPVTTSRFPTVGSVWHNTSDDGDTWLIVRHEGWKALGVELRSPHRACHFANVDYPMPVEWVRL